MENKQIKTEYQYESFFKNGKEYEKVTTIEYEIVEKGDFKYTEGNERKLELKDKYKKNKWSKLFKSKRKNKKEKGKGI